nr:helix-turn-helix transcriptional regulator [Clostridia bacterium]
MDIKTARLRVGMSQEDLAVASGVSRISIVRYESGERVPDIKTAARIANALGCKVDDLINKED